jgi:hypothetical protein
MKKQILKYLPLIIIWLCIQVISIVYLWDNYKYSKEIYTGTIITKAEEISRYSNYYIEVNFDKGFTRTLSIDPIEYIKCQIGDRYQTHIEYSFPFGQSDGYSIKDPKYWISNSCIAQFNFLSMLINISILGSVIITLVIIGIIKWMKYIDNKPETTNG